MQWRLLQSAHAHFASSDMVASALFLWGLMAAAWAFVLKGKLQVRDGVFNVGDFVYEPNGMLHGATTALEETEYLFACDGPVLFYDDDGLTSYLGWEELERMKEEQQAQASAG